MFVRSPLSGWIGNPEWYYRSVTAHGTTMAYVFPTLVAMGFGYFVTENALSRPLIGRPWAWIGLALVVVGTVAAIVPVALGRASVLYTFYPPLIGNPFYYIGVVLVVVGSWIWVALMAVNLYGWKRDNPGAPVPLPDVRHGRRRLSLGLDRGRRRARIAVPDHPGGAWTAQHDRRRAGARLLFLDLARDRLFLADADLHRLLHDRAAGNRRPAVQRQDGTDRLHPVSRRRDADRHPSRLRGSAGRRRLQIPAFGVHRDRRAADFAHRVHDLRLGRDCRAPARRQRCLGMADGAAVAQPGDARGRPVLCHARASAAPAGSST